MEELIEILIKLIGRMMAPTPPARQGQPGRPPMLPSTPQTPSSHGGAAYKPIPGARATPASRAVVRPKNNPQRKGRRSQPPPLMAAPIMTGLIEDVTPTPAPMPPVQLTKVKPLSASSAPAAKAAVPVDATAFRRWLTPATLRQQFLLTEIFQPPLALREPPRHLG